MFVCEYVYLFLKAEFTQLQLTSGIYYVSLFLLFVDRVYNIRLYYSCRSLCNYFEFLPRWMIGDLIE